MKNSYRTDQWYVDNGYWVLTTDPHCGFEYYRQTQKWRDYMIKVNNLMDSKIKETTYSPSILDKALNK